VVVRADNDVPSEYLRYEAVGGALSRRSSSRRVHGTFEVRGEDLLLACLVIPTVRTPQVVGLSCHPHRLRCFQLTFGALALTELRRFLRNNRRRPPWRSLSFRAPSSPGQASLPTLLGFVRQTIAGVPPSAPSSFDRQESTPAVALRHLLRRIGCHPIHTFRPRGFSPPRRFPPTHRLSGLLHPETDPGVHCVSSPMAFPATWIRTPRRIFLAQSRIASPRPLPSCRFNDFKALLPARVRGFDAAFPPH